LAIDYDFIDLGCEYTIYKIKYFQVIEDVVDTRFFLIVESLPCIFLNDIIHIFLKDRIPDKFERGKPQNSPSPNV